MERASPTSPNNACPLSSSRNAGGGGERVLWMAIAAVRHTYPHVQISVYTSMDGLTSEQMLRRAKKVFGRDLLQEQPSSPPIKFNRLWSAGLLHTFLQVFGMLFVGLECTLRFPRPDLLVDTLGVAFAYPVLWLANIPIVAYVHYPLLCEQVLRERSGGRLKMTCYRLLTRLYGLCGQLVDRAACNSTWTFNRIAPLWERRAPDASSNKSVERDDDCAAAEKIARPNRRISIIYPPCDLSKLRQFDVTGEREPVIFSLGQFRPEKNQSLQLDILQCLLVRRPEWRDRIHLAIYGGCRDADDRARADALMQRAVSLRLASCVSVVTDVDYQAILEMLQEATIGLHTMEDEHFGINIVEFMAAGPIAVAHASGGPATDIIREPGATGFLASTVEEYAETIEHILAMPEASRREVRDAARKAVLTRFDSNIFASEFLTLLQPFIRSPPVPAPPSPLGRPVQG